MSPRYNWRHNELKRRRNCRPGAPRSAVSFAMRPDLDRNPPEAAPCVDEGRSMRLALNGLAGNEQVPAATRRGKNDTLWYLYDLATSEARAGEGISRCGRSHSMCSQIYVAPIRWKIELTSTGAPGSVLGASFARARVDACTAVAFDRCGSACDRGERRGVRSRPGPGVDTHQDSAGARSPATSTQPAATASSGT